jgi:hypothetical protein
MLAVYRWQYIVTGVQGPRFGERLGAMIDAAQGARIQAALAPIVGAACGDGGRPLAGRVGRDLRERRRPGAHIG